MLGQSAGILFRIKADSSQAEKELRGIIGQVSGLGDEFAAMAGPAGIAVAAIAAIGAAAVVTAAALTKLAFDASEYGSAIFDATEKTGLSAETLSTIRVAADNAGSSFEGFTGSVSKFAVLLGQANQGNEKAIKTLEQYGIKSRDLESALQEVVQVIADEKDETLKAAAAKDLLKDKTGATIPVINQLGGDLKKATEDARRLGLVLSQEDVKAADDLGDAFGVLSAQVKAGASRFALQYAPQITAAINTISQFLANNKDKWGEWGRAVYDAVTGITAAVRTFGQIVDSTFIGITANLIQQATGWNVWAGVARAAIGLVTAGLSEVFMMAVQVGEILNANANKGIANTDAGSARDAITGAVNTAASAVRRVNMPSLGSGGGGSRGGGGGNTAEQERQKAVQAEEQKNTRLMNVYKAFLGQQAAEFETALQQKFISEERYTKAVGELRLKELLYQFELNKQMLANAKLNADERAEYENKQAVLTREIGTERIKIANEVFAVIKKNTEKELEDFQRAEEEKERIRKEKRDARNKQAQQDAEDRANQFQALKDATAAAGLGSGFFEGITNAINIMVDTTLKAPQKMASALNQIKASWQSMADVIGGAVDSFAQGVGNIVQNLVLMGNAGPNAMRKLVASVLAGVAAQAAVLAIFELAKGFAALFFNPAEAKAHFIAAALFGSIAVGTGLAGRAVAGDSFSQTASGAGASTGGQQTNNSELRYTTQFQGYGQDNLLVRTLDRINTTLGLVEETQHQFNEKVTGWKPGDIVALGAKDASRDIFGAIESELSSDVGATDGMMRNLGFAR